MLTSEIDQMNTRCYDAKASYWNRFPFPNHLPSLLWKYYTPDLGNKVLDIGSGTGRVASYFQDSDFEVTCLDPSSEMVSRCQKQGLKTIQTTIQAYKTEERFGIIIAILSLIHVPKAEIGEQITKIHQLLSDRGMFILSLLKGCHEGVEEAVGGYPRFFARYTPDEIRNILKDQFIELDYYEQGDYMLFFFSKK